MHLASPEFAISAIIVLAGIFDVLFGEPPTPVHPVAWIGRLIGAFERRRPRQRPAAEFAWGVLTVLITCGVAGGVAYGVMLGVRHLPWWANVLVSAYALKTMFSLRGLVAAGQVIQRALETDTDAAREELKALVSRSRD